MNRRMPESVLERMDDVTRVTVPPCGELPRLCSRGGLAGRRIQLCLPPSNPHSYSAGNILTVGGIGHEKFPKTGHADLQMEVGAAPLHIPDEQLPASFYVRMTLTGLLGVQRFLLLLTGCHQRCHHPGWLIVIILT